MDRAVASAIRKEHTWVVKQQEKAQEQLKKAADALAMKVAPDQAKRVKNEQSILRSAMTVLQWVVSGPKAKLDSALVAFTGAGGPLTEKSLEMATGTGAGAVASKAGAHVFCTSVVPF